MKIIEHSFFLKYYDYKTGIRYVFGKSDGIPTFQVFYNVEKEPWDEAFKYFEGIKALQVRLKTIFGDSDGEAKFLHLFQTIFQSLERYQKRKRR